MKIINDNNKSSTSIINPCFGSVTSELSLKIGPQNQSLYYIWKVPWTDHLQQKELFMAATLGICGNKIAVLIICIHIFSNYYTVLHLYTLSFSLFYCHSHMKTSALSGQLKSIHSIVSILKAILTYQKTTELIPNWF